jgi:hypothetical protein
VVDPSLIDSVQGTRLNKALDIVVNPVLVPNNSKIQDAVDRAHLVEKRIAGKLAKGSFVLQAKGIIFDSSTDG